MDNFNNQNYMQNHEYNIKKMNEFAEIIEKMKNAGYDERIKIMNETWPKELLTQIPTTIHYGDFCHVKIYMEDNKYHFEFKYDDITFEEFEKYHPGYIDNEVREKIEEIQQYLSSNDCYKNDTELENYNSIENLTAYNNIIINKKN